MSKNKTVADGSPVSTETQQAPAKGGDVITLTADTREQLQEDSLKYLADNDYKDLSGEELKKAISASINAKKDNLVGNMASQGTTPRRLTDLIGSLCDLTSGSGDKGTPVVLVQGYFDNMTD